MPDGAAGPGRDRLATTRPGTERGSVIDLRDESVVIDLRHEDTALRVRDAPTIESLDEVHVDLSAGLAVLEHPVAPEVVQVEPEPVASPRARRRRWWRLAMLGVLLLAAGVRAVPLTSGLPYSSYVDENHVLQPTAHMVAEGTWDPGFYRYPSLLMGATALGAAAWSGVGGDLSGPAAATDESPYYDVVQPGELLVIGRLVVLLTSIGTVAVTMLLARRLVGPTAGVLAGILVAVLPALVSRSAIVIVDTPATFFSMAALLLASSCAHGRHRLAWAGAAGAMCGLAFTAKYPSGATLIAVLVIVALARGLGRRDRISAALVATGAAGVAAAVAMPALVLRTGQVRSDIVRQADIYADRTASVSYWQQATSVREVGWVLLVAGLLGIVVLLRTPSARLVTLGWLAATLPFLVFLDAQPYQPFRNVIPLLPFLAIAAAALIVAITGRVASRWSWGRVPRTVAALGVTLLIAALMVFQGELPRSEGGIDVTDSRVAAVDWLERRVRPDQRVLVAAELALLPEELGRIPGEVVVEPATGPTAVNYPSGYDLVVSGDLQRVAAGWPTGGGEDAVATFGRKATPKAPGSWRTNRQLIAIHATDPAAPRS